MKVINKLWNNRNSLYWQSINTVLLASNNNAGRTKKTKL